jgi:hypothetical protein
MHLSQDLCMLARRRRANFSTSLAVAAWTTLHVPIFNIRSAASKTVSSNGSSPLQPVSLHGVTDLRSTDDEARRNNDIPRRTAQALALKFPRFDVCFIATSSQYLLLNVSCKAPWAFTRRTRTAHAQTSSSQSTIHCHVP